MESGRGRYEHYKIELSAECRGARRAGVHAVHRARFGARAVQEVSKEDSVPRCTPCIGARRALSPAL